MANKPYKLSAKVMIHDDKDRSLLLKRSMSSKGNPGKWDLPGGKVDAGESFEQALLREVQEETGLTISLQRVLGATESESPVAKVVYLVMEGRLVSGEVCLSSEHMEYAWVQRQKLPSIDIVDQFKPFTRS